MSQGTHTDHPFAPVPPPDRARLEAYLAGRLSATEAHAVERAMEDDPFLHEAMEGLAGPQAGAGLQALDAAKARVLQPSPPGRRPWFIVGAMAGMVLLVGAWLVISPWMEAQRSDETPPVPGMDAEPPVAVAPAPSLLPDLSVIAASEEQPETLRIGHRKEERPSHIADVPVHRDPGPGLMKGIAPQDPSPEPPAARPARGERTSRRLLFPHDLKLVHPDELYPFEPEVDPSDLNVSARYSDQRAQQQATEPQRLVGYTDFMGTALGKFATNDHKGCLEDLRFVLDQYPKDVNALFYAGLCSYNLALYGHARTLLHRAATHPVDSFAEEATWYHALTLDRLGETEAAREAFARIANQEGFYAERARTRLQRP